VPFLSPLRGLLILHWLPTAYAKGCTFAASRLDSEALKALRKVQSNFLSGMRREQEFGGHQVLQGAAYALEYGNFFRAASSLLLSTD
jgi:hypothetical protein